MRIAVVVRSLKVGGMERAAINLAEAFEANGHEAHLIYFKSKGKALEPNKKVHLHHFNLDKSMKFTIIGFFWNIFAKLMSMILRESYVYLKALFITPIFKHKIKSLEKKFGNFDLIILRGHGTFETLWPLKDSRVIQQQVSISFKYGNLLRDFYLRRLYHNKNIMCISSGVKDELLRVMKIAHAVPSRVEVITNPMDTQLIQKKSLEYAPDITSAYIVNVGRFAPGKNLPLLLEAYSYAKEHLGLVHNLVLVGDGHIRKEIEDKITQLGLQDSVTLTGSIPNPYPWIKHADLFVFTSFAEGLGNVLLEALACKTNIVSTHSKGGVADIMTEELATHLTSFDRVELAEKIVSELNRQSEVNFDKHVQKFSPKVIIQRYIDTYLQQ